MSQRIYKVSDINTTDVALVRAGNPSQAIRHATRKRFEAKVAGQEELVELISTGVEVETAGEEPPNENAEGDGASSE